MLRVLLADDHTMFREAVARLLEKHLEAEIVAQASTSPEAVEAVTRHQPDLVILDIVMPGRGGLDVLAEIKQRRPRTKVLILTSCPEDRYAVRCLRGGADGYVTKDRSSEVLVDAVRTVARGQKFISDTLAQYLAQSLAGDREAAPHESLSDRELEVMRLLAMARTVSEIADELHLSVKTISTYRTRILQKTGLKNNAEIMRYAMEEGLIDG